MIFEEAQTSFPLYAMRSKNFQNSLRVVSVGRNVGVSACAISQFPSLVDKELVKNAQQIYVGVTSENNALAYWKGILGKNAEHLKELGNGAFVYFNRNKISKIQIDPYDNSAQKTAIVIPEPKLTQPIKPNQSVGITLARLAIIAIFAIAAIGALR